MLTRLGGGVVREDSVGLLEECHARIRAFVDMAGRLAGAQVADPEDVRAAAGRVRRYFAEALPLHAQDEEESILPRVRGRDAELDGALAAMAREHREHEAPLVRLDAACAALVADPAALEQVRPALAAAAAELAAHFAHHLAREEQIIFPAVRRLLAPAEAEALAAEIRARRARPPTSAG